MLRAEIEQVREIATEIAGEMVKAATGPLIEKIEILTARVAKLEIGQKDKGKKDAKL